MKEEIVEKIYKGDDNERVWGRKKRRLERWYRKKDPWGYQTNPEDIMRKKVILGALKHLGIHFETALDIGCGEGWITKDLPADRIYGYDVSETALSRLPKNVIPLKELTGKKKYDLVVATDVLCKQNTYKWIMKDILKSARHIILICGIRRWERNVLTNPIYEFDFTYRDYIEHLAIYAVNIYVGHHICNTKEKKLNRNYSLRKKLAQDYVKFVTFDDVSETVWKNRDLLKNKKFILFPIGNYIGKYNTSFSRREKPEKLCTWEQLQDLVAMGGIMGWHTWTHPNLKRISDEQLKKELRCPFKVDYFAYPYGKWNSRVVRAVKKAGYKYAFSVKKGNDTAYQLRRLYL